MIALVECPLCHDPERPEDMVGGVCLTCADAIAFAQNARRGAVSVVVLTPEPAAVKCICWKPTAPHQSDCPFRR